MHGYDTYDYGWRGMQPTIMRFNSMDPLAEKYYSVSPYAYCANNPVLFLDPVGADIWTTSDPDLIRQFLGAIKLNSKKTNMSDWTHITDKEYKDGVGSGRFTINDKTGVLYYYYASMQESALIGGHINLGRRESGLLNDIQLAGAFGDAISGGAKKILNNRGAYMPRGGIEKVNIPVTVRTPIVNINTTSQALKYVKVGGKCVGVAGALVSVYGIYDDASKGKFKRAGAKAAVNALAAGAAFIPVAGWGISLGISAADYVWGDEFYDWVEK